MPIVKVEAPEQANTYDIHIGHGLLKKAAGLLERCRGHRAMIVTDENVAPLYLDAMKAQLEAFSFPLQTSCRSIIIEFILS